jgi:hypothetical protein
MSFFLAGSYLGICAAKGANFVVCVPSRFFDLELESFAGCVTTRHKTS